MIRGESHEYGMVTAMRILGCTRLSAYLYIRKIGYAAGTTCNSHSHSFGHTLIIFLTDMGLVSLTKFHIQHSILNLLYYMGGVIESPVCYSGREISYLKGSSQDLSLTDCN